MISENDLLIHLYDRGSTSKQSGLPIPAALPSTIHGERLVMIWFQKSRMQTRILKLKRAKEGRG